MEFGNNFKKKKKKGKERKKEKISKRLPEDSQGLLMIGAMQLSGKEGSPGSKGTGVIGAQAEDHGLGVAATPPESASLLPYL